MELSLGILIGVILAAICVYLVTKDQFPYNYHVAYSFSKEGDTNSGFGAMNVRRSKKITSSDDITSVREFIEKENKFSKVVLINWILLK